MTVEQPVILSAHPTRTECQLAKICAGRKHVYTQDEVAQLERFNDGATIKSIAEELGWGYQETVRRLQYLGIYKPRNTSPQRRAPLNKCAHCEIILTEAPEGYYLDLCNDCWDRLLDYFDNGQADPRFVDAGLVALQEVAG